MFLIDFIKNEAVFVNSGFLCVSTSTQLRLVSILHRDKDNQARARQGLKWMTAFVWQKTMSCVDS